MYSQWQKSMSGCGAHYYLNTILLQQQSRVVDILNIVGTFAHFWCWLYHKLFWILNFLIKISI